MTGKDGRPFKVGLMLPQTEGMRGSGTKRWTEISALARLAEDVGFDSLWVVDHFLYHLQGEARGRGVWECWSLLAALAATTRSAEIGTLVLGLGFRNPALLAKMAATVDEVSDGRLILGVGAGYHEPEYRAFGFPFDHRYRRFAEAIQIVHGLLKHGRVDFEGEYYRARQCELRPRGPRPQGPPLMFGCKGPRMLALTARYADSWNVYYDDMQNSVEGVRAMLERVDDACREAGRDPGTLERTATVLVADAGADPWWNRLPTGYEQLALEPLGGEPERIAEDLRAFARTGLAHLQISLEPTTAATIEALAPALAALSKG